MSEEKLAKVILAGIIVVLVAVGIYTMTPWYIVRPGYAYMHQRLGEIKGIEKHPGLYLKIPLIDTVTRIDTKICLLGNETSALSKDLQFVSIGVALNYRITDVEHVYVNVGTDFENKIIQPYAAESIKAVVAKYTAEELIQLRHEAKDRVCKDLRARLEAHKIELVEFNFVHVDFKQDFLAAVEAKQIAQQEALQSKNKTQRIQEEALQQKIQSDAEAYSLRIKKEMITKDLIEMKRVEKWDGQLPKMMMGRNNCLFDMEGYMS